MKFTEAECIKIMRFRQEARETMDGYGLNEWDLQFDNAVRVLGVCVTATKTLVFSRRFIVTNTEGQMRDTILHEIAHALNFEQNGLLCHGSEWRALALEMGCTATEKAHGRPHPKAKYEATCTECGSHSARHRRTRDHDNMACGPCYRQRGEVIPLTYRQVY